MKKLLLAFALIGFITISSYASSTIIKTTANIEYNNDGDGDKKCVKKDCKHKTKECVAYKKECTTSTSKSCHGKTASATSKSCCIKGGTKTASNAKHTNTKTASVKKVDTKKK